MSIRHDEYGQPLNKPPELLNNPNYDKLMAEMEFLALRCFHTGEGIKHADFMRMGEILKEEVDDEDE